jgi:hypothetical protein
VPKDELGLVAMSASTSIAREDIEGIVAPITEAETWRAALSAFAIFGPPTGNVDDNRANAPEQARQFVFSSILPREILGGDGLPPVHGQLRREQGRDGLDGTGDLPPAVPAPSCACRSRREPTWPGTAQRQCLVPGTVGDQVRLGISARLVILGHGESSSPALSTVSTKTATPTRKS